MMANYPVPFVPNFYAQPLPLQPFSPDVSSITREDIELRYKVMRVFLTHTEKVLGMLIQNGGKRAFPNSVGPNEQVFSTANYERLIFIKPTSFPVSGFIFPVGGWLDGFNKFFGYDIVSFHAFYSGKCYKDALLELNDAFENRQYLGDDEKRESEVKWHVQVKNSVSNNSIIIDDGYYNLFFNPRTLEYHNKHGRIVGKVVKFTSHSNENLEMFYTLWRRTNSVIEKFAPLFPEKPYMIFNQQNIKPETKKVIFVNNELEVEPWSYKYQSSMPGGYRSGTVFSACPGGLSNLLDADLTPIKNKKLVVMLNAHTRNFMFISELMEKCNELAIELALDDVPSTELAFITERPISEIPASTMLASPESFGLIPPSKIEYKEPGYWDVDDELPNADRQTVTILDPIINSGTINWLYAQPKVGKTLLGLCIAYAVEKGNRPVGAWKTSEPLRVYYIDGEMPSRAIKDHIERIMKGYRDDTGIGNSPFRYYNFLENQGKYDNIMDVNWQIAHQEQIKRANLVVLDNYNALNNNEIDVKPFFKWLKGLTRYGVAFLVIDHTNAEGELQGSQDKLRRADLTIKLEAVKDSKNTFQITYPEDRYGIETKSPPHKLEKFFSTDGKEFKFLLVADKPDVEDCSLKDSIRIIKFAYPLVLERRGLNRTDIKKRTGISRSTLDNILNAFANKQDLSESQKESASKISDKEREQILQEVTRIEGLSEDEFKNYEADVLPKLKKDSGK